MLIRTKKLLVSVDIDSFVKVCLNNKDLRLVTDANSHQNYFTSPYLSTNQRQDIILVTLADVEQVEKIIDLLQQGLRKYDTEIDLRSFELDVDTK